MAFDDPLTFPLAPQAGQYLTLSNTFYDQILSKLLTFPSATFDYGKKHVIPANHQHVNIVIMSMLAR